MLTADFLLSYREGTELAFPVGVGVKIYAGSLVALNSSGFLVPGDDVAGYRFAGVALEAQDNTGGGNGDLVCRVRRDGVFDFDAISITAAMVGQPMYLKSDHEFDESSTHGVICGELVSYIGATEGEIDIELAINTPATPLAADDQTVGDPGNYFPAATDTVKEQIQDLAKGPFFLTLPRFTGWTKDAAAHVIAAPLVESKVPLKIVSAFVNMGTGPGSTKTLALTVNGQALVSVVETATQAEALGLNIPIAADTDIIISANETAAGAGANCDLILVLEKDDGE